MNMQGAVTAVLIGGLLAAGVPNLAHAGDAQKGKDSKGQNTCSGKNGCKGKDGDQKPDADKKS